MIGKLTGTFAGLSPERAVLIDVGGVGYFVRVPTQTTFELKEGASISLFIHTSVREDAIDLYGFESQDELSFFKLLTSVSGVGPKTALGILNVSDLKSLKRSVAQGDATALTKVFGIGKKSAERIVVELRDKLMQEISARGESAEASGSADADVIEALIALGYGAHESRQALRSIRGEGVQERLSAALRELGRVAT